MASAPTIQVQFGGTGSFSTVKTWGPVGSPISQVLPWAAWQLLCGPVQSIVIQKAGAGYVAPTASASGGGGTGLVLGPPPADRWRHVVLDRKRRWFRIHVCAHRHCCGTIDFRYWHPCERIDDRHRAFQYQRFDSGDDGAGNRL